MAVDIILDAGHGGFDNGATYRGRAEKDDVLRLTLDVGQQLEKDGYSVAYIRTEDVYESPYRKAEKANQTGGDIFISFHRNSGVEENLYNGVQALVYSTEGKEAVALGEAINENLEKLGFQNLGVEAIPDLIVLHKTQMPAVLMEVGFINSDKDNELWDEKYTEIVQEIVSGIEETVPLKRQTWNRYHTWEENDTGNERETGNRTEQKKTEQIEQDQREANFARENHLVSDRAGWNTDSYRKDNDISEGNEEDVLQQPVWREVQPKRKFYVQTGLFKYDVNAAYQLERLQMLGYDGIIHYEKPYYGVWIGGQENLDEAVETQRQLQEHGYQTLIVSE